MERVALPGGLAHPEIGRLSAAAPVLVRLDCEAVPRADPTLRHKSTARGQYDAARTRAGVGEGGVFDVLMHNAEGELTECSIANVAVETEAGDWRTPPVACGLLAGVMREALLACGSSLGAGATGRRGRKGATAFQELVRRYSGSGEHEVSLVQLLSIL